jgi:hypothetical protein
MFINNMLAPYTDTTLFPTFDISSVPNCKQFIAGFIVADNLKKASWGGYYSVESDFYIDVAKKIRSKGGDITVSFGGAQGKELATVLDSSTKIYYEYKKVIDKFKLKSIDLDIEGTALYDLEACRRRGKAVEKLLIEYPQLKVSLTVPVMPFGLNNDAIQCMNLTPHSLLNIMAMDFGGEIDMGKAVISAIETTMKQTKKDIGVTVMIGKNDTFEIFTLEDAKELKAYLKKNKRVKRLSFWSIERDRGVDGPLATSSQIKQSKWEFTNLLKL